MGRRGKAAGRESNTLPTIDADELFDGMTGGDECRVVLDLEMGEVITVLPSDEDDLWGEYIDRLDEEPERYREVEPVETRRQYHWMVDFASSLHDAPDIARQLEVALDGRGAFGRFRNVLDGHPDLRARWDAWRAESLLEHATAWIRREGIRNPLSTPRALAPPIPRSDSSSTPAEIGLVHVLLLGAADGKTELLEGKVHRAITAESKKKADQLFRRLVRHACVLDGIDYRRSLVDERDQVTVGDITLSRRGLTIDVSVVVPRSIWDAFSA